jgi:hypothetical protein
MILSPRKLFPQLSVLTCVRCCLIQDNQQNNLRGQYVETFILTHAHGRGNRRYPNPQLRPLSVGITTAPMSQSNAPRRTLLPLHPIGFAVWPPLALYGQNVDKLPWSLVVIPLLVFASIGVALPILFRTVSANWAKASAMATVTIIALCCLWKPITKDYLLFYSALEPWIFYSLYGLILLVVLALIQQRKSGFRRSTTILNAVAFVMLTWPTIQIVQGAIHRPLNVKAHDTVDLHALPGNMEEAIDKPNVVLLILDEYSRADFLDKNFGFDNKDFLDALKQRGFIVSNNSMSNYIDTTYSIPSMLNMDYLSATKDGDFNSGSLRGLVENNLVLGVFNAMGYETYAFTTGFWMTEPGPKVNHILPEGITLITMIEFTGAILEFTPANEIAEALGFSYTHDSWRNNILNTLDELHRPIADAGDRPAYIRAHVVAPHPPFIFDADGGARKPDKGFSLGKSESDTDHSPIVQQTMGLNKHVLRAVDSVIATSENPPIIIITSDHSTVEAGSSDRGFDILLAVYFPGIGEIVPRKTIDSLHLVNLFRLVFNTYFDAEFSMLKNKALTDPNWLNEVKNLPTFFARVPIFP